MTNIVKDSNKKNYVYSAYETVFDGKDSWSFGNGFARNVVIFSVDNSLSSHTNNQKNDFLVLGGNHDAPEKNFSINFSKAETKFDLSLHYNGDNSYLFINRKTSIRLKQVIKKSTFFPNFF